MGFESIYQNKTVLLTGHTGFKGSWLAIWLKELGANVIGYALDPLHSEDIFSRTGLSEKITDNRGDIRNYQNLLKIFEKTNPDIIFHLAAQPIVRDSYDIPLDTFNMNSLGTANVLECIRKSDSAKAAVFITTDKVYRNNEDIWPFRENDPLGGHDPYSASKASAEIIIDSYRKSFFSNSERQIFCASARAGNVIGGGDWQNFRLVPDCIRDFQKNIPVQIRNPSATRPWQLVIEAIGGYLLLGEKLLNQEKDFAESWNFGPEIESVVSVEKLVENLSLQWPNSSYVIKSKSSDNKHEAQILSLDITKAYSQLGWKPVLSLKESIKFTVDWYRYAFEHPKDNLYDYSKDQIDQYIDIARKRNRNWME